MNHLPLLHTEFLIHLAVPNYIHFPINLLNFYNQNYKSTLNVTNLIIFLHKDLKHIVNSFFDNNIELRLNNAQQCDKVSSSLLNLTLTLPLQIQEASFLLIINLY